ncbi:MAG: sigma-70 family RNA polymerase sigma factor [Byssovorax sp.]
MAIRANRGRLRLVEPVPDPAPDAGDAAPQPQEAAGTPIPGSPAPSWESRSRSVPPEAPIAGRSAARAQLATLPDAQLVALGCKGETPALEILYRRHAAFAIHLATRIEGSARDVEDIAHDAFLRAFERLNDLSDRGAFRSWLGAIVVHAVRSRMRRGRLMSALGLGKSAEPVDLDAIASSDASPQVRAQIAQIYALLRTLPTDDRIAWTLRAVEGHDLETVARLTRCSLATVKRRISRTQRFLDDHFVDPRAEDGAPLNASPAEAPAERSPDHPEEVPS